MANDNEKDYLTLKFDDGKEEETEVLGVFDFNEKEYIALLPTEKKDGDVYIFGYKDISDDEYELVEIESNEEFEAAAKEIDRIMN
jgi:uncharacterized protein YrzB (UPF0473 family)